jgi:hypothetical protein
MIKHTLVTALTLAILAAGASGAKAAQITLDTFDVAGPSIDKSGTSAVGTGTFSGTQVGTGILGGERKIDFTVISRPSSNRSALAEVSGGQFVLDTGPSVLTGTLLTWDGIGTSGLNTNLTQDGLDAFRLAIVSIDQVANLTFTVRDNLGNTSSLTRSNLVAGPAIFNFANFTGNANFSNAFSVTLNITAPQAIDLTLDILEVTDETPNTVPEPLTLLGSAAAVGFGALLRRKQTKLSEAS